MGSPRSPSMDDMFEKYSTVQFEDDEGAASEEASIAEGRFFEATQGGFAGA